LTSEEVCVKQRQKDQVRYFYLLFLFVFGFVFMISLKMKRIEWCWDIISWTWIHIFNDFISLRLMTSHILISWATTTTSSTKWMHFTSQNPLIVNMNTTIHCWMTMICIKKQKRNKETIRVWKCKKILISYFDVCFFGFV
jgi:nucleoside recognition membrane protein YjiH